MPRLGVIGTLVWDTIRSRRTADDVAEAQDWGGIAYSLAAFEAVAPAEWTQLPILKVGEDLRSRADDHLRGLTSVETDAVRTVPEPTNRVTLYYEDDIRRCEHLTGGVPGWEFAELRDVVHSCDALYINFIAGWELDLETAMRLRRSFDGAIYADIHSLMLAVGEDGVRTLRPLPDWREWLRCFDFVQLNEDELRTLDESADPWCTAAEVALQTGDSATRALLVTLGAKGSAWVAPGADLRIASPRTNSASPSVRLGCVRQPSGALTGDTTGCGDVWGMACYASLAAGETLESAMETANRTAGRNVESQGASGLAHRLRGP